MMSLVKKLIADKDIVFFDFDGVLVDSVNIKRDAFQKMYQQYGTSIALDVMRHHEKNGGMSRFEKFSYYHKHFLHKDLSPLEIDQMSKEFSNLVIQKVIYANWIPGAQSFLEALNNNFKKCVIVSATPQAEIEKIIKNRGMARYFTDICGSPTAKHLNLEKIMNKYYSNSRRTVFFGDAMADWEAAHKLGIPFIGVGEEIKKQLLIKQNKDCNFIDNFNENYV